MKTIKFIAAVSAAALILTSALSAETINTIEQVENTALLNNLDYKNAVLDVLKAENALETVLKLESSSVSLSGSYAQGGSPALGWQASASLPVIEQLSIGAAVDDSLQSSVSINLNPLVHSSSTAQSRLTYDLKLAAAEEKAQEISDGAVQSYLEWTAASADLDLKTAQAEVKKLLYEDEKVRYAAGEAALDEVREAFTAWSESRTALNSAQTKLQSAELSLYSVLNIDSLETVIEEPDAGDLYKRIDELEAVYESADFSIAGNYSVLAAETAAENLALQLKSTWLFEPQLNVNSTVSFPTDSNPSVSATASLTLGLDSWNAEEREELQIELEISRQQTAQTILNEQLNLQQAMTNAETAAISLEVAEVELEQAEELLDEAEFLFELGDYSETEMEETALQYEQSKNNLFSAAAAHYTALRTLAAYID